jgi:large subunit ribosomal protein L24
MLSRVKKNDMVLVTSGKDKGKQGHVISVDNKKGVVMVKGIAIATKHLKAKRQGEQSRIVKEETQISLCKVMPFCPSCKKACRVQVNFLDSGKKTRICHRCKEAF